MAAIAAAMEAAIRAISEAAIRQRRHYRSDGKIPTDTASYGA
ncbi:hypothetical protein [Jiella sp. M17.18]